MSADDRTACGDKKGTYAGFNRHGRAEEKPCDDCRAARNEYRRAYYVAHPRPGDDAPIRNTLVRFNVEHLTAEGWTYVSDYADAERARSVARASLKNRAVGTVARVVRTETTYAAEVIERFEVEP